MTDAERDRFDALVDDAMGSLPGRVRAMLEEVSVVVLDEPEPAMLKDLGVNLAEEPDALDEICGLHTGTMLTEKSVEHGDLPTVIHLFRRGIVAVAGGWGQDRADEAVYEEVRVTLLHEIGHHFGLDEDDLEELGYD